MSSGATIYTVHARTGEERASLRLVPHGFSLAAFIGGPIWLAFNRLWLAAILLVGFDLAILLATRAEMLSRTAALAAFVIGATLVGLEGREWLRSRLAARSPMVGLAIGGSEIEALAAMPQQGAQWEARV